MIASSRLLVFGATGRTGRRLVAAAAARGLRVAAFVRDAARVPPGAAEVHVGDVRDPDQVRAAVREGDLVVATLGGSNRDGQGGAIQDGARTIVAAARAAGAARLLAVVGAGVLQLDTTRQRHEAPDYPPMLRSVGAEHQALYRSFAESGLWWALVCTPRLLDEDPTGRMVALADYLPDGTGVVTTGDVATLLLDLATEPAARGGRIGVSCGSNA
jgi:putative NADH-flavin reductase